MANYLVTGGAGFIGSNIVEELVRMKGAGAKIDKIRVIDNFSTGKMENIAPFLEHIELIKGDIRDNDTVNDALKNINFVLHEAAMRSVPKSIEDPLANNDVNITGTLNLLIAAKKARVKRFIYASSSSVYGDTKKFPQKETDRPVPISPYGVSKLAAESYCIVFARTLGLETVSLRYFNVFGPRQDPESKYSAVIPNFISKMLKGESPVVEWDGKQSRDFTYVQNIVKANLKACATPGISGEVFNVACGHTTSVIDIVNELNDILNTSIKPQFAPRRRGDIRKSYASIIKMQKFLKIGKIIQFGEGLKSTVNWIMKK